jgi:hypothetical protein
MKLYRLIGFTTGGLLISVGPLSAEAVRSDLPAPAKRAASVELAKALMKAPEPAAMSVPADAKDPLNPYTGPSQEEIDAANKPRPQSAKEILSVLMEQLPAVVSTGTNREGQRVLFVSKKQVKVGERIPITFENSTYEVELTEISGTSFTLKYNGETQARPLFLSTSKPGKTP